MSNERSDSERLVGRASFVKVSRSIGAGVEGITRGGGAPRVVDRRVLPKPGPRSASEIAFVPPKTATEARKRIADLDYDIAHIDQQFAVRNARGGGDPDWRHRASRARMIKDLERARLRIWLEEHQQNEEHALYKAIVDVVRSDYDESEWKDVLAEAQKLVRGTA